MTARRPQREAVRSAAPAQTDRRIAEVLRHLAPSEGFEPWHGGPTALGALRGVTADVARWRPWPDRHTIWELALHVAYWDWAVERRLGDLPRGGFPRSPSDWPRPDASGSEEGWEQDRRLVRDRRTSLVAAVSAFDPARLDDVSGEGRTTFADLITGVLLHDTYHAGQIQLMKRMARSHFGA